MGLEDRVRSEMLTMEGRRSLKVEFYCIDGQFF